jgi:hypothetical protein
MVATSVGRASQLFITEALAGANAVQRKKIAARVLNDLQGKGLVRKEAFLLT